MNKIPPRTDDFETRREHLRQLTDEELKERFWQLTDQVVAPLVELARTHTSPSIERSVLLRMGFSDLEAKSIVEQAIDHQLISKGVGHVVFRYATMKKMTIREAGLRLQSGFGWDEVFASFEVTSHESR